jgi:hypothetical protein
MSNVYVVQEQPFNYTDAERFGELVFVTNREISGYGNFDKNVRTISEIKAVMTNYIPTTDFLVLTGNPITIGVVFHEAAIRGSRHKILHWDNQARKYRVVEIVL